MDRIETIVYFIADCPHGGSHIDLVSACLLGCFFGKFIIAIGGFSSETKEPKFKNWVYFEQIIVKTPNVSKLFYRKKYTDGWIIGRKIGVEKLV